MTLTLKEKIDSRCICLGDPDADEVLRAWANEPDYFFGYVQENGYLALKRYTTKARYKEVRDDHPIFFISKFYAKGGWPEAYRKIKKVAENLLACSWNNWDINTRS